MINWQLNKIFVIEFQIKTDKLRSICSRSQIIITPSCLSQNIKIRMSSSLISDSQKEFIRSSIRNDLRIDGRRNCQGQKYQMKINNLEHLLGSCLVNVQTGHNEVHIYTGIKIRVQKLAAVKKDINLQVKSKPIKDRVQIQLGCIKKLSQEQEQTRIYIQEYLQKYIIDRHLQELQSLLSISEAKRHCLSMSIEAYILSTPHICYLQYLHLCVKSALKNLQMPHFSVVYNEITDEEVVDVSVIGETQTKEKGQKQKQSGYCGTDRLRIVGQLGDMYVLGMTLEEYQAVDSCLLIAIDKQNKVTSFETLKGTTKIQELHQVIKFAKQ